MLFIIGFIIGIFLFKNIKKPNDTCSLHEWNYDINGMLMCSKCKIIPGQEKGSEL
jgi:hypothetical protein